MRPPCCFPSFWVSGLLLRFAKRKKKGTNMATTLEALERRLGVLEQEMASLRPLVAGQPVEETPAERGARLLAQARRDKSRQKVAAAQAFAQMGITQAPVTPEKLRALMAECGVKPEDNLFSQGILEMRDE